MTRPLSYTALILGILFFIASFFTEAKSENVCINAFPAYYVPLETKCAIETLAGDLSIECGTLKPSKKPKG